MCVCVYGYMYMCIYIYSVWIIFGLIPTSPGCSHKPEERRHVSIDCSVVIALAARLTGTNNDLIKAHFVELTCVGTWSLWLSVDQSGVLLQRHSWKCCQAASNGRLFGRRHTRLIGRQRSSEGVIWKWQRRAPAEPLALAGKGHLPPAAQLRSALGHSESERGGDASGIDRPRV